MARANGLFMISYRLMKTEDVSFIYATMLRGVYYGNEFYRQIEKKSFFNNYAKVLEQLLSRDRVVVVVACLSDDIDVIVGYTIIEPGYGILHWCFVKEAWRSKGIATGMLASAKINIVTHLTKLGNSIRIKKNWVFDPFKI